MSSRPSVLIVSNGRGEDAVGAALADALRLDAALAAYPLVGLGDAYREVTLLDPRQALPGGGFTLRGSARTAARDLRSGAVRLWLRQRQTLAARVSRDDAVVAAGDAFCLWMAGRTRTRAVFVATAKSVTTEPHRAVELWVMRRHARIVFTRDAATAEALIRRGIDAHYVGNPLMDTIPPPRGTLGLPPRTPAVLLLPGSRADALINLMLLLKVCARVSSVEGAAFVCALPPTLPVVNVVRSAIETGWEVDGEALRRGQAAVLLTRDYGAALDAATVAVGLAGTANEQAAGRGRPVVAFPVAGAAQATPRFLTTQQRLLGDALVLTPDWEGAAAAVTRLLQDAGERRRRGEAGRNRMGEGGAVPRIAEAVRMRLAARETRSREGVN